MASHAEVFLNRSSLHAGTLPAFANCQWRLLTTLYLQSVYPTGPELALLAAADWPCLKTLDLARNDLTVGSITELAKGVWPVLSSLVFDDTLDTAAITELISGKWPKLMHLSLCNFQLDDKAGYLLTQANWRLSHLDVARAKITGNFFTQCLGSHQLPLQYLELCSCHVDCILPNSWPDMPCLKVLGARCVVLDVLPIVTTSWASLVSLDLARRGVKSLPLTELPVLRFLRFLDLSYNDIESQHVRMLKQVSLPCLQILNLCFNPLSDADIDRAFNSPSAQGCSLAWHRVTASMNDFTKLPSKLAQGFGNWPQIRKLDLTGCSETECYSDIFLAIAHLHRSLQI